MLRIGPGKTSTKPAQGLSSLISKPIPFLKETSGRTPGVSFLGQHSNAANAPLAEARIRGRFTSRLDLADFMLHQVTDGQYVHQAAAVATVKGAPNFLGFLWKEGIRKKAA
jgi:hypothetical protein